MAMLPTELGLASVLTTNLEAYQTQLDSLQGTLAAGQAISKPSDSPTGVVDLLDVSASLSAYQQYQANLKGGQTVASLANSALSQAVDIVQQMNSVLVQAGSPGVSATNAKALAHQLAGLETSLLGVANTSYLGQAIFGGTQAVSEAYLQPGGPGTAVTYQGNSTPPTVAVAPGVELPTSLADPLGASSAGGGIFAAVNQAIADLNGDNLVAATGADLGNLQAQLGALTNQAASAGVNYRQFGVMATQATNAIAEIQGQIGSIQNLDYAKLTTQYQAQLNNYHVALYAAAQINQPTLAQYLS